MSKAVRETLKHNLRQALSQGRLRDAEDILSRLKKEDPLGRDTRGFELEFYLIADRLTEADALARQLCVLFPDSGRILYLAGKISYKLKRYDEAASQFRESARIYPHWSTQHWLGKTLTQTGQFEEAEALLVSALEHNRQVLLDLAWLYERKNDLQAALKTFDEYLVSDPGNAFASEQRLRIKAKMLEPEALIEEVEALEQLGEEAPDLMFPEFVQRLFETGQSLRAREEVQRRAEKLDARTGVRVAWVCYLAQAYDLACTLFLRQLQSNTSNYKYLNALESAAAKCRCLPQLLEAYRALAKQEPQFHGRIRTISRRMKDDT